MKVLFSGGPLEGRTLNLKPCSFFQVQNLTAESVASMGHEIERFGVHPKSGVRVVTYVDAGRVMRGHGLLFRLFVTDTTPRAARELLLEAAVAEANRAT